MAKVTAWSGDTHARVAYREARRRADSHGDKGVPQTHARARRDLLEEGAVTLADKRARATLIARPSSTPHSMHIGCQFCRQLKVDHGADTANV
eukprot:scaffold28852_cov25-Tisochrysis_lutea.AAC.2